MPLPIIFGPLPGPVPLSDLDQDFAALGALAAIPCTISGTNALTFTVAANTPTVASYTNYQPFSGIAVASNTTAVTATIGALGALPVFKDTNVGPIALSGGEISQNNLVTLVYDSALNTGGGGFHLAVRGATPVVAGAGLFINSGTAGGTITPSSNTLNVGQFTNAQVGTTYAIANGDIAKRVTLSNASAVAVSLPQAGASSLFVSGWWAIVQNLGAGLVTITPTTSTINGATTLVLQVGQSAEITSNGTNYFATIGSPINVLASSALSSRIPDSGTNGGNVRGNFAIDIQPYGFNNAASQVASGVAAIAIGAQIVATGSSDVVIGVGASATTNPLTGHNIVIGPGAVASATAGSSVVLGSGAVASGSGATSVVIGPGAAGTASQATVIGQTATGNGVGATIIGNSSTASGRGFAGGLSVVATGTFAVGLGFGTTVTGQSGVGIGSTNTVTARDAIVIGSTLTDRGNIGNIVIGNGDSALSSLGQDEKYRFYNVTSTSAAVVLSANSSVAGAANVANLANNSAMLFTADFIVYDKNTGKAITYNQGPSLITRGTSAATTVISSGNPSMIAGPASTTPFTLAAAPTISADVTNGGFSVGYTPPVANTDTLDSACRIVILYQT